MILLLFLCTLLCALSPNEALDRLSIKTTSGVVSGFEFHRKDGEIVNAWRGIPYAAPPVGQRRWKPPAPPETWDGDRNCSSFGNKCVQPHGAGDEDCLFLNIYTPHSSASRTSNQSDNAHKLLPVLFYIHGGSLTSGDGEYDMTALVSSRSHAQRDSAEGGLVLVEINYRLNIFGFLSVQELGDESVDAVSGNYGILDQIRALRWTQDNIARFGGDPSRVTIAGQSSGGTSVFALLSSPLARGLFSAAYSLSGSANLTMSMAQAYKQNDALVEASGCRTDDTRSTGSSEAVVACLRSLPPAALVRLIPPSWASPGMWALPPSPLGLDLAGLPVVDGVVIAAPFDDALAQGLVDVPLLMGNMAEEPDAWPEQDVQGYSLNQWREMLHANFDVVWDGQTAEGESFLGSEVAERVFEMYRVEAEESVQRAHDRFVTDFGITCASIAVARKAAGYRGGEQGSATAGQAVGDVDGDAGSAGTGRTAPVYVSVNTWRLSESFSWPYDPQYNVSYAYHTLDLTALTTNWEELTGCCGVQLSGRDLSMGAYLQSQLVEFVGNSGRSVTGLQPIDSVAEGWPEHYNVLVIDGGKDQGQGQGKGSNGRALARMETDYKRAQYDYFSSVGLLKKGFWWVN